MSAAGRAQPKARNVACMNDVLARPLPPPRTRKRVIATAAALDVVIIIIFATLGRSTHAESLDIWGVLGTAWPFIVAGVAGWVAFRSWRKPLKMWPVGVGVWGITWGLGMVLRAVTGGGTALPFVLVAAGVLGAGLLGWRLLAKFAPAMRQTYPGLYQE